MSTEPEPDSAPEAAVSDELIQARLEAAAVRAGLDDGHLDIARALLPVWLKEKHVAPHREHVERFVTELKTSKPQLFAAARRSTAPVVPGAGPPAPTNSGPETPHQRWRTLEESGSRAEAEAYYRLHRRDIMRGS